MSAENRVWSSHPLSEPMSAALSAEFDAAVQKMQDAVSEINKTSPEAAARKMESLWLLIRVNADYKGIIKDLNKLRAVYEKARNGSGTLQELADALYAVDEGSASRRDDVEKGRD